MIAIIKPQLTERERSEIRSALFKEKKRDFLLMQDVMAESDKWHTLYASGDFVAMGYELNQRLWSYLERTGMFEKAEQEILSSMSVNGPSWREA